MKRYKKQRCFKFWWSLKYSWGVMALPLLMFLLNALDVSCGCSLRHPRSTICYWKLSQSSSRENLALHTSFEAREIATQLKWCLQRCFSRALQQGSDQEQPHSYHDLPSEELDSGVLPQKGNKGKALPLREGGTERGWSQENCAGSSLLRSPSAWKLHSPGADGFCFKGERGKCGYEVGCSESR